jgi:hypothetical protein
MTADLGRPAEILAQEVEYTAEQDAVWEWYLRLNSYRKAAAAASEQLGLDKPIPVSTAGFWIKQRREREEAIRQVMHLFSRAELQQMTGHTLKLMFADAQIAVAADGTRLEKLGPYMLAVVREYIDLLGLRAPTRISIEDDRANTVEASYVELKEWEERNAAKFDEIKRRK